MPDRRDRRGLLVVFEGIDGSGKTTLSGKVAAALRATDLSVTHVRPDGRLASETAESIRRFVRDPRQLGLTPVAELLLYLARERQQLDEAILPALATADVVIADRYFYSAEVLACDGRGLPEEQVAAAIDMAGADVEPDLVVLVDVDPEVALARRTADRTLRPERRPDSRKGLSGAGLLRRLRDGYLRLAAAAPERWVVIDNTAAPLPALAVELAELIQRTLIGPGRPAATRPPRPAARPVRRPADALRAFVDWLDDAVDREPEAAAAMLHGLAGEPFDQRRRALATRVPALVAAGLRGLADPVSWELRDALAGIAPDAVARSLADLPAQPDGAWRLRRLLVRPAPHGVAASLAGLVDARADELRRQLWEIDPAAAMAALAGDGSPAAWALRDRWLAGLGDRAVDDAVLARAACASITGLDDPRAWQLRGLARAACPVGALLSLAGVTSDRAWLWRDRHAPRALEPVLRTITGLTQPRAWAMRAHYLDAAAEVLDTFAGSDDEPAWALRARAADRWPAAVAGSLGLLVGQERGRALLDRLVERHPADLGVLRQAALARALESRKVAIA